MCFTKEEQKSAVFCRTGDMGYLFLGMALLCGAAKGYCGKKTSGYIRSFDDSVTVSLFRMACCVLIGLCLVPAESGGTAFSLPVLCIGMASGAATTVFVLSWILSVRTGSYMMVDIFLTSGVILPVLACHFLYGEELTLRHGIGFVLLLVAVFVMCGYNNKIKGRLTLPAVLLLTVCGLSNGTADLMQKVYLHHADGVGVSVFNLYTYLTSAVLLLLLHTVLRIRKARLSVVSAPEKHGLSLRNIWPYILVMSACLFFYSFLKTRAAGYLPSVVLYPISQAGGMMLTAVMAAVFFGEKITKRSALGMALALSALLLMNL